METCRKWQEPCQQLKDNLIIKLGQLLKTDLHLFECIDESKQWASLYIIPPYHDYEKNLACLIT